MRRQTAHPVGRRLSAGSGALHVEHQAFRLQKAGNSPDDYEDAFYQPSTPSSKRRGYRFAIADGATEASFSGLWAALLAAAYGEDRLGKQLDQPLLQALRQEWKSHLDCKTLPWYAEEKARLGAFSSLLGLQLSSGRGLSTWQAIAVGDSCLFQLRGNAVVTAFPLTSSDAFNDRPYLISSNAGDCAALQQSILSTTGEWRNRDVFLLMTDALACWFLRANEAGELPWETIRVMADSKDPDAFSMLIQQLRLSGELRNDDVTLLIVVPTR